MYEKQNLVLAVAIFFGLSGKAFCDDADLATQISNPIASLINVPFPFSYDSAFDPNDGYRVTATIQAVIPISLDHDWNMISRIVLPIIVQEDIASLSGSQSGLGDIIQSLFFSSTAACPDGVIWGACPVFSLPTATDDVLGAGKWGTAPTEVVLKQYGPWTAGLLANHIWSFAGDEVRNDVNSTFLQPFFTYTTSDAWTFGINTESSFDRTSNDWSVPINLTVAKLAKFGDQPVSFALGTRCWAENSESGPDGWGFHGVITPLFPKWALVGRCELACKLQG